MSTAGRLALGQGAGSGTAVVVLRSPDVLLAAVDSNEIICFIATVSPRSTGALSAK